MSEPQKPELVAVPPDLAAARNRENPPAVEVDPAEVRAAIGKLASLSQTQRDALKRELAGVAPTPATNPEKPVPVGPIRLFVLTWLSGKPWWVTAIAVGLMAFGGAVIQHYREPAPPPTPPAPVINVTLPPAPAPSPQPVQGVAEVATARERVAGQRFFGRLWRERAERELRTNGFAAVNGDPKPLDAKVAARLVERLDDELIATGFAEFRAAEGGQVYQGPVIDWLKKALEWIRDHPEEVRAFIKFLLTLLMLFAAADGTVAMDGVFDWLALLLAIWPA